MIETIQVGKQSEEIACCYLEQQGLKLIERNFNCRLGEIDLIMLDKKTIVFVEVRYRKNNAFGGPIASITHSKQQKLRATAKIYLQQHPRKARGATRFDVIGISGPEHSIEWIQNAFDG